MDPRLVYRRLCGYVGSFRSGPQGHLGIPRSMAALLLAAGVVVTLTAAPGCSLPPPAENRPLTGELDQSFHVDSTVAASDEAFHGDDPALDETLSDGAPPLEEGLTGVEAPGALDADPAPDDTASGDAVVPPAEGALAADSKALSPPGEAGDGSGVVDGAAQDLGASPSTDSPAESVHGSPSGLTAGPTPGKKSPENELLVVEESSGADLKPVADATETLAAADAEVETAKQAVERDPDAAPPVGIEETLEPTDLNGTQESVEPTESSLPVAADPAGVPDASPVRTLTTDDGLLMTYETAGLISAPRLAGDEADLTPDHRAVVFIHGWCGNRSQWDVHMEKLAPDHRVVSVDLLGHGDSASQEREEWTVPRFGRDVAALIVAEDLSDVVLVGHAMGGQVALEVALRLPERIVGIIGVESLHDLNASPEPAADDNEFESYVQKFENDFAAEFGKFIDSSVHADTAKAVRDEILGDALSCDQGAVVKLMKHFQTRDLKSVVRSVECPVYCINSRVFHTDIEGNRVLLTGFDATSMDGVGFWPHLELPESFQSNLVLRLKELAAPVQLREPATLTALWPVVYCDDMEAVEAFYIQRLQFAQVARVPVDTAQPARLVTLERDGQRIGIQSRKSLAGEFPSLKELPKGGQMFFLTVTNLVDERQRLGEDIDYVDSIRTLDTGSQQTILRDPEMNLIVLQQPPRRPGGKD